jgi:tRNA threonylcarbamoyladenosine biosynthesis protein TsaE
MADASLTFPLPSDEDTSRLGRWFARHLDAGDVMALEGPIGAGKTHFARALIRERMGTAEDVPSPTFTLIQTYPADVDIWHADLYRLTHPDEVLELGLDDAFQTAICLIEWPERMGTLLPSNVIRLRLIPDGEQRLAKVIPGPRPALAATLRRDWGAK